MDELSIKEKASRYDEAIEVINKCKTDKYGCIIGVKPTDIFPALKESENERIRKDVISFVEQAIDAGYGIISKERKEEWIAWLEKKGEQKHTDNVEPKFKVKYAGSEYNVLEVKYIAGITFYGIEDEPNHMDYVLPDHCEIIRGYGWFPNPTNPADKCDGCNNAKGCVACVDGSEWAHIEEHKPADEAEPKFKVGDWVVSKFDGKTRQISEVHFDEYNSYYVVNGKILNIEAYDKLHHLWTIQEAKDGDVLVWDDSKCIALFKNVYDEDNFNSYGFIGHCTGKFEVSPNYHSIEGAHPATKEQRDLLFAKMKEAGCEWDAEKKELKKIEQKVAWSEENKRKINRIYSIIAQAAETHAYSTTCRLIGDKECIELQDFIKSLKDGIQPQSQWKPSDEQIMALRWVLNNVPYNKYKEEISGLLDQIKDL